MMGAIAEAGPYKGNAIRRARKEYSCDEATGWGDTYRRCKAPINPGDQYVEGDTDPYRAGGFGRDRICLKCAMLEARAAALAGEGRGL
jgi:hypothetical protein